MRCKTCHYSLANLTENRCPECGNAFDPSNPSTYDSERPPILTLRRMLHIAITCYVLNVGLVTYIWLAETPNDIRRLLMVPVAAAAIMVFTFPIGLIVYGAIWIVRSRMRSAG